MHFFQHLGKALELLRKDRGLSQTKLAEVAETSIAMVNRYEKGRSKPTIETLDRLLNGLASSPAELADYLDLASGKGPARRENRDRQADLEAERDLAALKVRGVDAQDREVMKNLLWALRTIEDRLRRN